jgi:hypothetical protein
VLKVVEIRYSLFGKKWTPDFIDNVQKFGQPNQKTIHLLSLILSSFKIIRPRNSNIPFLN